MNWNEPITITLIPEVLFTWFALALVGGGIAGLLLRAGRVSIVTCLLAGVLGGIIGSAFMVATQAQIPESMSGGPPIRYIDLVITFMGAALVLLFDSLLRRRGSRSPQD